MCCHRRASEDCAPEIADSLREGLGLEDGDEDAMGVARLALRRLIVIWSSRGGVLMGEYRTRGVRRDGVSSSITRDAVERIEDAVLAVAGTEVLVTSLCLTVAFDTAGIRTGEETGMRLKLALLELGEAEADTWVVSGSLGTLRKG